MLHKFELTGVHFKIDDRLHKYVMRRLGSIDRYIPRHEHDVAHLEVRLSEAKVEGRVQSMCEAVLHIPHTTITLTETGATMYVAADRVRAKLREEITRFKDEYMSGKQRRHVFGRVKHKLSSIMPGL